MKLPPLHALRAFDAVARLGGVRAAADALFVTPGAVTQQLRALEQYIGLPIVERVGRGLRLTEVGRALHLNTARHLRAIGSAAESLRSKRGRVRVTAAPSVAVRWLIPRLRSFSDAHPEIEVLVEANPELVDLRSGDWDVALREGDSGLAGLHSQLLFSLDLVPVASPDYAQRDSRHPAMRWQNARLLHDAGNPWWSRWLENAKHGPDDPTRGLYFSHTALCIAAAIDSQGVALAAPILVQQELAGGQLVILDSRPLITGIGVYAAWIEREDPLPAVSLFREWLPKQAVFVASP